LLYAFVEFHESSCAQIAIQEMDGVKLLGRRMKVNWTDCKPAPTPGADQWVQVHVNFACRDPSLNVSEEYLESVFIQFGNIGDVIVKRHSCSTNPAVVSGYAFIYFIDAYAAFRAIHGCKGINLEMIQFECALSRQYENAMSSQQGNNVPRGFKKPAPSHGHSGNVTGPSSNHHFKGSPPVNPYRDNYLPQNHYHSAPGKFPHKRLNLHSSSAHSTALPNEYFHRQPSAQEPQSRGYMSSTFTSLSSHSSFGGLLNSTSSDSHHHGRSFTASSSSFAAYEEPGRELYSLTTLSNWRMSRAEGASELSGSGFSASLHDQFACEEFLTFLKPARISIDDNFDKALSCSSLLSVGEDRFATNALYSDESIGNSLENAPFSTSEAV
jgi:RNA recognition motif-containing protein